MKTLTQTLCRLFSIMLALIAYFALLTGISYSRAPERFRMDALKKFTATDFIPMGKNRNILDPGTKDIHLKNEDQNSLAGCFTNVAAPAVRSVLIEFTLQCVEGYESGVLCIDLCGEHYDNPEQEHQEATQSGTKKLSILLPTGECPPDTYDLRIFTLDKCDLMISKLEVLLLTEAKNTIAMRSYVIAGAAAFLSMVFFRQFLKSS